MIAQPTRKPDVTRVCENCGKPFTRSHKDARKSRGRFCGHECGHEFTKGKPQAGFITPKSDKALRVRANGLVNKRLKLGWFEKPKGCMRCGKPARLDSHHADYSKPDHVYWLCRSCHVQSHHTPDILNGLAPFVCDRSAAPRPPKIGGNA